ncbi:IS110 family transposase [Salinicoccus sp. HZC-1]|uniref:IS110 family transposase n=1 Tax=Salinicoccus sp. HZC-1 TaxID=3385497 RepID=UPI00398AF437
MLFVGIDVAKHKHDIAIIDDSGDVRRSHLRIKNNREGFELLNQTLKKLQEVFNEEITIAMEDTGIYSMNLLQFLQSKHYMVHTYNPLLIKEFARSTSLRKTKTDKKDALTIAHKCFLDRKSAPPQVNPVIEELKRLTRHRSRIGKNQADLKIQYTRVLDLTFPELSVRLSKPSMHLKYVYAMLSIYPSITQLADAHLTRLTTILKQASRGRVGKARAVEIRDLARTSIGTVSASLSFELKHLIEVIQFYQQIIQETDQQIQSLMAQIQSPILTIPGISHRLGSVILAEIRSIEQFQNPGQLLAFSGLEPSIYQSGTFSGQGKMVKRGSPALRWAILQARD